MWRRNKRQVSEPNDEVYDVFNLILSNTEMMEHNARQNEIWKNCFNLSRWLLMTTPNSAEPQLYYAKDSAFGDRLCVFAFTDEQHAKEFAQQEFGRLEGIGFVANSPQIWVQSLSESDVEGIIFNAGPKGWSWFAPIENLRSIQEYVRKQ